MLSTPLSNSNMHSLVHRGPGIASVRTRWQPYATPASQHWTPNTPASSVSSSPPVPRNICQPSQSSCSSVSSSCTASGSTSEIYTKSAPTSTTTSSCTSTPCSSVSSASSTSCTPRAPLARTSSVRDLQKSRYICALVDQAAKSISEIWHPEDIPAVFTSVATPRTTPIPTQTVSMPSIGGSSFGGAGFSNGAGCGYASTSTSGVHVLHASTELSDSNPALFHRNSQLPSPVTPSTQPSPPPTRPQHQYQHQQPQQPIGNTSANHSATQPTSAQSALPPTVVPIKGFVCEVLRRSKTSAGVLQTALCYLEAIRHKVPVLAAQERMGLAGGDRREKVLADYITVEVVETVEDMGKNAIQRDSESDDASDMIDAEPEARQYDFRANVNTNTNTNILTATDSAISTSTSNNIGSGSASVMATVKVLDDPQLPLPASPLSPRMVHNSPADMMMDTTMICSSRNQVTYAPLLSAPAPSQAPSRHARPEPNLPELPPMPSPLLCPRRTFLAAVILASKFTQDKTFSNKAWARLAGLPPREIGRCERALGAALDWRLWVGKVNVNVPATSTPSPVLGPTIANQRPLGRTQTSLDSGLSTPTPMHYAKPTRSGSAASPIDPRSRNSLGRSRTLPANCFGGIRGEDGMDVTQTQTPAAGVFTLSFSSVPSATLAPASYSHTPNISHASFSGWAGLISSLEGPGSAQGQGQGGQYRAWHASPSSMSTPGLSFSPASTASSGDPTPHMVDFHPSPSPFPTPSVTSITEAHTAYGFGYSHRQGHGHGHGYDFGLGSSNIATQINPNVPARTGNCVPAIPPAYPIQGSTPGSNLSAPPGSGSGVGSFASPADLPALHPRVKALAASNGSVAETGPCRWSTRPGGLAEGSPMYEDWAA